jgi:hypothetical protein
VPACHPACRNRLPATATSRRCASPGMASWGSSPPALAPRPQLQRAVWGPRPAPHLHPCPPRRQLTPRCAARPCRALGPHRPQCKQQLALQPAQARPLHQRAHPTGAQHLRQPPRWLTPIRPTALHHRA